jgi:hypothetical protein
MLRIEAARRLISYLDRSSSLRNEVQYGTPDQFMREPWTSIKVCANGARKSGVLAA